MATQSQASPQRNRRTKISSFTRRKKSLFFSFVALFFCIWICVAFTLFEHLNNDKYNNISKYVGGARLSPSHVKNSAMENPTSIHQRWSLMSRNSSVKVTADVRGNLGPASVVNQDPPGKDWIKDRWQAASDMGGTAIPGKHWIQLEFPRNIRVTRIVLDWETAFAKEYRLEGRVSLDSDEWCLLYDGSNEMYESKLVVEETGQSPGVKRKMPLHVVHKISMDIDGRNGDVTGDCSLKFLRLFIKKPFRAWGVSLWQFDVYGTYN